MTRPNATRDPESVMAAWLDEGPTDLPDVTRRAILTALPTTPQARRGRFAPRRFLMIPKLLAATAAVVIVVAGGLALFGGGGASVGAPASPAVPSPTVAPSPTAAPKVVDQSAYGYTITIPSSWNAAPVADWPGVLYLSAAAPITGAYMFVGEASGTPATYTLREFGGAPGMNWSGSTAAELADDLDAFNVKTWNQPGRNRREVTVDGETGVVVERTWKSAEQIALDMFVIHGTRAYHLELNAPVANAEDARAAFDALVSSIRWSPAP